MPIKHQEEAPKRRMSQSHPDELSFDQEKCRCGSQPFFGIRNGRLLLRCKEQKCLDVEWSGKDDLHFSEEVCPFCNIPLTLLLSRTPQNPGKLFYKCFRCKYFKWWRRSLQTMGYDKDRVLNEGASSSASVSTFASSSASSDASASSPSNMALIGEVLCTVGEMMKKISLE